MPPHCVSTWTFEELAIQLPFRRKNGACGVTSIVTVSPGSTPATSTHPPCGGAVKVVTKNEPPPSTLRLSPLHDAALGLGLQLDSAAVGDHRAGLAIEDLVAGQDAARNGE